MFSDDGILKGSLNLSFEDFKQRILDLAEHRPKPIRKGQYIYNYCAGQYAERVKKFHAAPGWMAIDCYYDDNNIDIFLKFIYGLEETGEPDTE